LEDQAKKDFDLYQSFYKKIESTAFFGLGISYFFEHIRTRPLLKINTRKGSQEVIKA
jgi:hypothetical protein